MTLWVCSLEKASVENVKMRLAQTTTSSHSRKRKNPGLFHLIVGRLARDDDVVNVAFTQTGGSDSHKAAALLQFAKIGRTAISHAAAQPAGELVDETAERPLIRNAAFHALGHRFPAIRRLLSIPVSRARF